MGAKLKRICMRSSTSGDHLTAVKEDAFDGTNEQSIRDRTLLIARFLRRSLGEIRCQQIDHLRVSDSIQQQPVT